MDFINRKNLKTPKKENIKIGLYLQTGKFQTKDEFDKAMRIVTESDIDILVFPEYCYTPFSEKIKIMDIMDEPDMVWIFEKCVELSDSLGKAIIFSGVDKIETIFSVYSNAFANESETGNHIYMKHTATVASPLGFKEYDDFSSYLFDPIIFKDSKIGLSICYDCNHSIFSRIYGVQDVDIIINSTGGNVIRDKWEKYNKARAIENHCFNFVTMGGEDLKNSFVFGFNPGGEPMKFKNLMQTTELNNLNGTVYVFETNNPKERTADDSWIEQTLFN